VHVQRRLLGATMRSVCARQVQGVCWIGRLHGLRDREVFYSRRGFSKFDLPGLRRGQVWRGDSKVQ
jgi:hypothetical protein